MSTLTKRLEPLFEAADPWPGDPDEVHAAQALVSELRAFVELVGNYKAAESSDWLLDEVIASARQIRDGTRVHDG